MASRAHQRMGELRGILNSAIKTRSPTGLTVHSRIWVKEKSRLKGMRDELREIKTNLGLYFSGRGSTYTINNTVLLRHVQFENIQFTQTQNQHARRVTTLLEGIARQLNGLNGLPEEQRRLNNLLQDLGVRLVAETRQSRIIVEESSQSQQQHLTQTTTTTETKTSRFKIEFSRFQKRSCTSFCSCVCHKRTRFRSPTFARRLLGSLCVGYSSIPLFAQKCSEETCREKTNFSATFTYYFPSWLISKMISLIFITTAAGDPAACLSIRPLNRDFSIFRMASTGDLSGIKSILGTRNVHPSVGYHGGWTPLHYAITHGHAAVCKLLVAAGADPNVEDNTFQQSALDWAWTRILGNSFPHKMSLEFQEIFNDRDCLEETGWAKIVID